MKKINLSHLASEATTCALTVIDNALGHSMKKTICADRLRRGMEWLIKDAVRDHFRYGFGIELEDEE